MTRRREFEARQAQLLEMTAVLTDRLSALQTSPDAEPEDVDELARIVRQLQKQAEDLEKERKSQRRTLKVLAVSFAFNIALTLGLGTNAWLTHAASHAACRQANVNRAENLKLWNFLLAQPPQPGQNTNPELIARFRVELAKDFAPIDCNSF